MPENQKQKIKHPENITLGFVKRGGKKQPQGVVIFE